MKNLNKKQKRIVVGFGVFWVLLIAYVWLTANTTIDKLKQKEVTVQRVFKDYDRHNSEFAFKIEDTKGQLYSINADYVNCIVDSLYELALKDKIVKIRIDQYDVRALLNNTPFVYSIIINGDEYLDKNCIEKSGNNNLLIAFVFGLIMYALIFLGFYLERLKST